MVLSGFLVTLMCFSVLLQVVGSVPNFLLATVYSAMILCIQFTTNYAGTSFARFEGLGCISPGYSRM